MAGTNNNEISSRVRRISRRAEAALCIGSKTTALMINRQ